MGLCGSKDSSFTSDRNKGKGKGKKSEFTDLHGINNGAAGMVVYLPTTGPLTAKEYKERLSSSDGTQTTFFPRSNYTIRYAYVSQRGYYPDSPNKANQDAYAVHTYFQGDPEQVFFGIFDGHGEFGTQCATFARDKVPQNLSNSPLLATSPEGAFHQAMVQTNMQLHRSEHDDSMSGTTSISVFIRGRMMYIANVGDSRAVLAMRENGRIVAHDLSYDQTPYRKDECLRVRQCGARVLTLDQLEGLKDPNIEFWGTDGDEDGGDPPRLWLPDATYPGTAFTRSIGDNAAERIGVFAEPEVTVKKLMPSYPFIVIASDGVFEFLPSQSVVDMVSKFDDPQEACYSVVAESYRLWLQHETRTDDITMMVLQLHGLQDEAPHMSNNLNGSSVSLAGPPAQLQQAETAMPKRLPSMRLPAIDVPASPKAATTSAYQHSYLGANMYGGSFSQPSPGYHSPNSFRIPLASQAFGNKAALLSPSPPQAGMPLTQEQRVILSEAVRNNFLFANLDPESRQLVFDVMERRIVQAGEMVIRQGEQGNHFYVVDTGTYDVYINHNPSEPPALVHTYVASTAFRPAFGELALLYSKPRAATVLARTEGSLWMLHRDAFKAVLKRNGVPRTVALSLRKVEVLQALSMSHLQRLADAMQEAAFNAGEYIFRQGDGAQDFFVIESGEVQCTVRDDPDNTAEDPQEVLRLGMGQFVGERALMVGGTQRAANVVAVSNRVVLLRITRMGFEALFGPLQAIIDAEAAWRARLPAQKQLAISRAGGLSVIQRPSFSLDHLTARGLLCATDNAAIMLFEAVGQGASTSGAQGNGAESGEIYTLRVISVTDVVQQGKESLVLRARGITKSLEPSPFVPGVIRVFKDDRVLAEVLSTVGLCTLDCLLVPEPLDEASAVYVAASVILGLEHLHWSQVIFRGLSVHSVIVTEAGQVQLVDFRFARQNEGRTFTLCGNPEYLAPEMVENRGHDQSVDLWSLGVFIYGIMAHDTPFATEGDDELQIYRKILSRQLNYPPHFSPSAIDLIDRLLQRDPAMRLGNRPGGWAELKQHPWFAAINWTALLEHRLPPPAGLRDRIFHFEGVEYACFDPQPEKHGDTSWINDF